MLMRREKPRPLIWDSLSHVETMDPVPPRKTPPCLPTRTVYR